MITKLRNVQNRKYLPFTLSVLELLPFDSRELMKQVGL